MSNLLKRKSEHPVENYAYQWRLKHEPTRDSFLPFSTKIKAHKILSQLCFLLPIKQIPLNPNVEYKWGHLSNMKPWVMTLLPFPTRDTCLFTLASDGHSILQKNNPSISKVKRKVSQSLAASTPFSSNYSLVSNHNSRCIDWYGTFTNRVKQSNLIG